MIKGITATSPFLQVHNGDPNPLYYNTSNMSAGMVRYYNNEFQVYDGQTWLSVPNQFTSVSLTQSAVDAINWASKQMFEDRELEQLSKDHPSVAAALENVRKAQEQLKITIILSKDESTTS